MTTRARSICNTVSDHLKSLSASVIKILTAGWLKYLCFGLHGYLFLKFVYKVFGGFLPPKIVSLNLSQIVSLFLSPESTFVTKLGDKYVTEIKKQSSEKNW